jgi:hypothetical protein
MHDSNVQVQSGVKLGSFNYNQFKKKTIVMNVCKNTLSFTYYFLSVLETGRIQ